MNHTGERADNWMERDSRCWAPGGAGSATVWGMGASLDPLGSQEAPLESRLPQMRVPDASNTVFGVGAQDPGIETCMGPSWPQPNTHVTSGPKHAPGLLEGPCCWAQVLAFVRQAWHISEAVCSYPLPLRLPLPALPWGGICS